MLAQFVLFSATLAFLFAIGELWSRPGQAGRILALLLLALALILLHNGLLLSHQMVAYIHFFEWNLVLVFTIGPLAAGYFRIMTTGTALSRRRAIPHFLPAILILLYLLPDYLQSAELKRQRLDQLIHSGLIAHRWIMLPGIMHLSVYLALSLYSVRHVLHPHALKTEATVRYLLFFAVYGFVINTIGVYAMFTLSRELAVITYGGIALLIPLIYLVRRRHPELMLHLGRVSRREKYRRSQLGGHDRDELVNRLTDLMETEQIYLTEDLTLAQLAAALRITPHQLSELFNDHLKTNFAGYINGFRVRHACRMLIAHPEQTVLTVAYDSGFQSRSTFHSAFTRETGMSPIRYRKNHLKSGPD